MAISIANVLQRVLQRFHDPELELAYRAETRSYLVRQTQVAGRLLWLIPLILAIITLLEIGDHGTNVVTFSLIMSTVITVIYAWLARNESYILNSLLDVALIFSILPLIYLTNIVIIEKNLLEWNASSVHFILLLFIMIISCVALPGTTLTYLLSLVGLGLYYLAVLDFQGLSNVQTSQSLVIFGVTATTLLYVHWTIEDKARALFKVRQDLKAEKAKSDHLLDAVLPAEIAQRLRENEEVADDFHGVAIVFVDIVGFTRLSEQLGPRRTVEMLNTFFNRCDQATELFGMEKIKTIGDCYMAVAGALTTPICPARAAVDFAAYLVREAHVVGEELGLDLKVSVGINVGEVVGGVISSKRLSYDYWGDAVNVSARLQGLADKDGIAVSEGVYQATRDSYTFHPPRTAHLKNLGDRQIYDVALDLGSVAPT